MSPLITGREAMLLGFLVHEVTRFIFLSRPLRWEKATKCRLHWRSGKRAPSGLNIRVITWNNPAQKIVFIYLFNPLLILIVFVGIYFIR